MIWKGCSRETRFMWTGIDIRKKKKSGKYGGKEKICACKV